tara:strand:+ start:3288 stop:4397 length:1110 start_codon:yes stop_codon:yes gene_type:complete
MKNILVTGSDGFIGKNLYLRLSEIGGLTPIAVSRADSSKELEEKLAEADFLIHLAGANRPTKDIEFVEDNVKFTQTLCDILKSKDKNIPILFSSSTQAALENPYGKSKLDAEAVLEAFSNERGAPLYIYRLPGVFGKWAKPNYNSVIATFCHNIANSLTIDITDRDNLIDLVYIDDVVDCFIEKVFEKETTTVFNEVEPVYQESLGSIADLIKRFSESRKNLTIPDVGSGFCRALYSTYLSYLPEDKFLYELSENSDERGTFVEILKTMNSGQFSFFSAKPGITRGIHYHHTKTEKFLVVKGKALFRFRNLKNNSIKELFVDEQKFQIVESIPGWVHSIKNIGTEDMIVVLWANEIFDIDNPDTITAEI